MSDDNNDWTADETFVFVLTDEGEKALADMVRTRPSTPWEAALFQRIYKGVPIWTENAYVSDPVWEWHVHVPDGSGECGRSFTKDEACKKAEEVVERILAERRQRLS